MCLCWVDFVLLPSKRFFAMWCHAGLSAADEAAGEVLEHSAWAWRKPWRKCQAVPSLKRAPENRPKPKREVVFQSSIFRCYVSFREISGRVESRFLCGNAVFWICADLVLTSTWETDLSCVCVCANHLWSSTYLGFRLPSHSMPALVVHTMFCSLVHVVLLIAHAHTHKQLPQMLRFVDQKMWVHFDNLLTCISICGLSICLFVFLICCSFMLLSCFYLSSWVVLLQSHIKPA